MAKRIIISTEEVGAVNWRASFPNGDSASGGSENEAVGRLIKTHGHYYGFEVEKIGTKPARPHTPTTMMGSLIKP